MDIINSFKVYNFGDKVDVKNSQVKYRVIENNEDNMIYFGREVASSR